MRVLHRPVWEGIQASLVSIFKEGRPADKVIQWHLKNNKKWGSQDRRLFAEAVYDLVRWWRKLLFVCQIPWPQEDRWAGEDAKAHALVLQAWCLLNEVQLGKGLDESTQTFAESIKLKWVAPDLPRAVAQSLPNWLDDWGSQQLPENWNQVIAALNTVAPVFLRANRLKTNPKDLIEKLRRENIEAVPAGDDGLRLLKRANVFLTDAFKKGLFEVQDLSSQAVAPALGAMPGERVVDACAGAGGKSLHLAALMQNKGKIVSMDVSEKKLLQLRERSTRAGATLIETRFIESRKSIKRLHESFDRVLLDVPCSGLGVLRRNPDSKWKLKPADIEAVMGLQKEILADYARMAKPGGTVVYATCSIAPSENLLPVQDFVSHFENEFTLETYKTMWPEVDGADGFFYARLTRRGRS